MSLQCLDSCTVSVWRRYQTRLNLTEHQDKKIKESYPDLLTPANRNVGNVLAKLSWFYSDIGNLSPIVKSTEQFGATTRNIPINLNTSLILSYAYLNLLYITVLAINWFLFSYYLLLLSLAILLSHCNWEYALLVNSDVHLYTFSGKQRACGGKPDAPSP